MKHYKFVGGPWDGEYHEADNLAYHLGYIDVIQDLPFKPRIETEVVDILNFVQSRKITRYTLREFTGSSSPVYCFADSEMSDIQVFSQLVHHYLGKS